MSNRSKNVSFIRVSRRLEVSRSPLDGMWRAWVLMPLSHFDLTIVQDMDQDDRRSLQYLPDRWVVAGAARKARDAIAQAREATGV